MGYNPDADYDLNPKPKPKGKCFPANTQVYTKDGIKYIEDVQVGDLIHDGEGFSEVWVYAHYDITTAVIYYHIQTEKNTILISEEHFLDVKDPNQASTISKMANQVTTDDCLINKIGMPEKILKIEKKEGLGMFAPFTLSGKILVNEIRASCYAVVEPTLAHGALEDLRAMYKDPAKKNKLGDLLKPDQMGIPQVFHEAFKSLLNVETV
ncbi:hypothetical protein SNE40_010227 [Patella caerulea]|uniref:Hint domain-containing protein n=1 Tax=Patella caerulea TaxID=87958 RepID=A0AAN8K0J7_PATCE